MSRHIPRKRFGQNFLQDPKTIFDIVSGIGPRAGDVMIEIGPGLAALTRPLLERLGHLHVVEIDRDIISRLKKDFKPEELTIHEGDALAFDFAQIEGRLRIVGNLPYNISTPLLFHLASYFERVDDMHFMLQKEVVDRMVAEPSTPDFGRLSVMLQYHFEMEKLLDVAPEAFYPPPKVDSAVVRMIPHAQRPATAQDEALFAQIVLEAFGQRRKTLRNNLHARLKDSDFEALGIAPSRRAESVSVADFVRIANYCSERAAAE